MVRLTRTLSTEATNELLEMLARYPNGLPTKDLVSSNKFHGSRTLSPRQITRLLRASGKVDEHHVGQGMYTQIWWRLKRREK